jgi:hypothetical protein
MDNILTCLSITDVRVLRRNNQPIKKTRRSPIQHHTTHPERLTCQTVVSVALCIPDTRQDSSAVLWRRDKDDLLVQAVAQCRNILTKLTFVFLLVSVRRYETTPSPFPHTHVQRPCPRSSLTNWLSHLNKISVVHLDRPNHAYLNPLPNSRVRPPVWSLLMGTTTLLFPSFILIRAGGV